MPFMKKISLVFSFVFLGVCSLFGFDIVLNTGKDGGESFASLHLQHDEPFECVQKTENSRIFYECVVQGAIDSKLDDQNFDFFDLKFTKGALKTQIFIYPKSPVRLYNLAQPLYKDENLSTNLNANLSTHFTFYFTEKNAPQARENGLNFGVVFPQVKNPSVGALDLNSNPVIITQSGDINVFLRIKQEFEQENYEQVITDAANAVSRYDGSIFMNEFMLYRLRAQNKLYTHDADYRNQEILEKMVEEAKVWTRSFASDKSYPEVLYITLRAYIALEQRSNVEYAMKVLSTEHPKHYFTDLARLDYADYLLGLGKKDEALRLYDDVYLNSQNADLATRAALSTAKLALNDKNKNHALSLINTALKANANYFKADKERSFDLAGILNDNNESILSARLYELGFEGLDENKPNYEEILRNLALTKSKTDDFTGAKKYLDLYNENFPKSEHSTLIREALDGIFFNLPDTNSSFLHARYKDLQENYANEIAAKALLFDVRLYADENNSLAVMGYKDKIERYENAELKGILGDSALKILNKKLADDDCLGAVEIFDEYKGYDLGVKTAQKKVLLACLKRTFNSAKALEYATLVRDEDVIFYDLARAEIKLANKNNKNALRLAQSVINSRLLKSEDEIFRANYVKFLAQLRDDDYNEAVKTLDKLNKMPMNYAMVELYNEFLFYCTRRGLVKSVISYAPRAIDYQNLRGVNVYTPELEFMYLNALNEAAKQAGSGLWQRWLYYGALPVGVRAEPVRAKPVLSDTSELENEALRVLNDLLKARLMPMQRARALYMQSEIHAKRQNINAQRAALLACANLNMSENPFDDDFSTALNDGFSSNGASKLSASSQKGSANILYDARKNAGQNGVYSLNNPAQNTTSGAFATQTNATQSTSNALTNADDDWQGLCVEALNLLDK